jgi:nucleoside-diphosphate-sugar epimerase
MKPKVLLLGATGRIGPSLISEYKKEYSDKYELIIGIHNKNLEYNLPTKKIDLLDLKSLEEAFAGIDVVINLAANANEKEEDFTKFVNPNIIGAYNVFEAARKANCKRVIFASSVHVIKGYPIDYEVHPKDNPLPLNFYAATKVFGEALCNVFSSKYNLSCLAIRVGAYVTNDLLNKVCFERETYHYVITQRDFAELIYKSIIAENKIKFGILAGISNNKKRNMDLEHTKQLINYEPKDEVFDICEKIKSN